MAFAERLDTNTQAMRNQLQASNQNQAQAIAMMQVLRENLSGFTPDWRQSITKQLSALRESQLSHGQDLQSIRAKSQEHLLALKQLYASSCPPTTSQKRHRPERICPQIPDFDFASRPNPIRLYSTLYFTLGMEVSRCGSDCRCLCHSPSRSQHSWRLPSAFKNVVGSLFMGYSGFPTSASKCHIQSCSNGKYLRLAITYGLPLWFINYSFHVLMEVSTYGFKFALVPRLRVTRLISEDNILYQARNGTLDAVREIIRRDKLAILHVEYRDGHSALFEALFGNNAPKQKLAIMRELLAAGLSLDQEDDRGVSVRSYVTHRVVLKEISSELRTGLEQLFPISDYVDDLGFTFLHKIVTNYVCRGNILTLLESRSPEILSQVNSQDRFGRTPLIYAARRGDFYCVRALLNAGAIVDTTDINGWSAMFHAAISGSEICGEVMGLLLAAGADVNLTERRGHCALHMAAQRNSSKGIRKLLAAGARIDLRATDAGFTPGAVAVQSNSPQAISVLVEHGADVNERDTSGKSLLARAIMLNCHEAQEMLLRYGASYHWVVPWGNIVHYAARYGDHKTLTTLADFKLQGVATHLVNDDGNSATAIFESRRFISDDLRAAFNRFLESLEENVPGDETLSDSDDPDEEFLDAREDVSDDDDE